jgi:hypothetical protein
MCKKGREGRPVDKKEAERMKAFGLGNHWGVSHSNLSAQAASCAARPLIVGFAVVNATLIPCGSV